MPRRPSKIRMQATTIRFPPSTYAAISRRADAEGISIAQYVREAALMRAAYDAAETGEDYVAAVRSAFADMIEELREASREGA